MEFQQLIKQNQLIILATDVPTLVSSIPIKRQNVGMLLVWVNVLTRVPIHVRILVPEVVLIIPVRILLIKQEKEEDVQPDAQLTVSDLVKVFVKVNALKPASLVVNNCVLITVNGYALQIVDLDAQQDVQKDVLDVIQLVKDYAQELIIREYAQVVLLLEDVHQIVNLTVVPTVQDLVVIHFVVPKLPDHVIIIVESDVMDHLVLHYAKINVMYNALLV